jgi:hypothetical protein
MVALTMAARILSQLLQLPSIIANEIHFAFQKAMSMACSDLTTYY